MASARIGLNNGLKVVDAADLTDAEVSNALLHAESMDADLRESLHGTIDDERLFLIAYCAGHEHRHGTPWALP